MSNPLDQHDADVVAQLRKLVDQPDADVVILLRRLVNQPDENATTPLPNWALWSLFFGPLLLGGLAALTLGDPKEWGTSVPAMWLAIGGLTVAMYVALEKWKDELEDAEALDFLARVVGLAVAPFVLGTAFTLTLARAIDEGWNTSVVILTPIIVASLALVSAYYIWRKLPAKPLQAAPLKGDNAHENDQEDPLHARHDVHP